MCVLIVHLHTVPGYPIVVGANRDEVYERPSARPALHAGGRIFAPTDLQAGGTWLGLNRHGVFAAIANRSREAFDPDRASRGALCRAALESGSAIEAAQRLEDLVSRAPRNGFNLLVADGERAFAMTGGVTVTRSGLGAGTHTVTNLHEPDEFQLGDSLPPPSSLDTALAQLREICRDHTDRDGYQICKHRARHGTVSSALIAVSDGRERLTRFLFADGAPCAAEYEDVGEPVRAWTLADRVTPARG